MFWLAFYTHAIFLTSFDEYGFVVFTYAAVQKIIRDPVSGSGYPNPGTGYGIKKKSLGTGWDQD